MRSTVPILVGDPERAGHSRIKYSTFMQSFIIVLFQLNKNGEKCAVRTCTSKKLSEALSMAIDWADNHDEVVVFRKASNARGRERSEL